jgi:hypothetical protein
MCREKLGASDKTSDVESKDEKKEGTLLYFVHEIRFSFVICLLMVALGTNVH